jgi:hypothetical protein
MSVRNNGAEKVAISIINLLGAIAFRILFAIISILYNSLKPKGIY